MIGETLARYRVLAPLGRGGMGVVYRAHDPHLERDVALKVLPDGALADEDSRARFRREALSLSQLSHPAIGTVFDFDTQDGVDFLVMEYVPGDSLAARLATGALGENEALDLGLQIAEALEAAHEQGVVHRDLKPANVMVTPRGRVKVLDFGLAKLRAHPSRAQALTGAVLLGTAPYMAPEQLLGADVDGRADVFAFGALLYEMLTGRPAFGAGAGAEFEAAVMNQVLNRAPVPPRQLRPELAREVEALVLRCLEKSPERRLEARELAAELRRLVTRDASSAPARPAIESIAVLPLENLSRDPDQEYFADGMTEALIADLARIAALRVISRTSAMRFKGVRRPLPDIARELGVDAIVEGSVLRAGDRVRITAQLIDAATDRHLWAGRYERELSDVLGIQSEVAQAVAREIQVQLTQQERAHLDARRRFDPEAHEAYLKGRFLWKQRSRPALEAALLLFNRAIDRDPTYAPAFSGLADSLNILADANFHPPDVAFPRARAAALQALALDEGLAEAHCSLGYVKVAYEWDWEAGEREYRVALDLDRDYPSAHQWYGSLLAMRSRFDEAIDHGLEAVRRDPLSFILYSSAGDVCYYARRLDQAMDLQLRGIELAPEFGLLHMDLGRSFEAAGRYDEALAEYQRGLALTGTAPNASGALGCVHAAAGRTDEAHKILDAMRLKAAIDFVPPYAFASVHARLGEVDAAIEALETAFHAHDRALVFVNVNPRFDRLRGDPRFQDLVRRMRLVP
jgi:TolB-like protein/Tfp pilus assembly protein PilF